MSDQTTVVAALREAMARFVTEREWDQFHSPKNLAMALGVEAAELMEHFLWIDNDVLAPDRCATRPGASRWPTRSPTWPV